MRQLTKFGFQGQLAESLVRWMRHLLRSRTLDVPEKLDTWKNRTSSSGRPQPVPAHGQTPYAVKATKSQTGYRANPYQQILIIRHPFFVIYSDQNQSCLVGHTER
jgi:hypothetical protein